MLMEFICDCFPQRTIHMDPAGMPRRPSCNICESTYKINVAAALDHPHAFMVNRLYTPDHARDCLLSAFPLAIDEIPEDKLKEYTDKLNRYRWTHCTIGQGGYLCPITFVDGHLLLGATRLQAVVNSGKSIHAATLNIGANHAEGSVRQPARA